MAGIYQRWEIEIFQREFCDGTGVGHHVAPTSSLQDDGKPGFDCAGNAPHAGHVHSTLGKTLKRDLPKGVIANE